MSYTVNLQQRIQQLKKAQANLPDILYETQKEAAQKAVEAAADAAPPKEGRMQEGVNMLTGELKQHWATDSAIEPERISNGYVSILANEMEYASYVDQGHRLDKHFVPGLYIDPTGALSRDLTADVGLVVGTKTKFVKGKFMVDKAKEAYESTIIKELDGLIEKVMK